MELLIVFKHVSQGPHLSLVVKTKSALSELTASWNNVAMLGWWGCLTYEWYEKMHIPASSQFNIFYHVEIHSADFFSPWSAHINASRFFLALLIHNQTYDRFCIMQTLKHFLFFFGVRPTWKNYFHWDQCTLRPWDSFKRAYLHCLHIKLFIFAITVSTLQDNGKSKPAQIAIT